MGYLRYKNVDAPIRNNIGLKRHHSDSQSSRGEDSHYPRIGAVPGENRALLLQNLS